jgi:cysteinyl-tRNA synthetase
MRLFDTARGDVFPVEPRDTGKVSMYVCGPTVYGPPHLGHGRQTLVYDVLRRYLEWTGLVVDHVSNITDVDDNIINRAARESRDWTEVAAKCEAVWWRAMDAIGVLRPTANPHASAFIDRMIELVQQLFDAGVAYETSDGVYFEASKVPDYGLLALQSIDSLQAGARVEANEEKRAVIDFVLWKKAKAGEPSWPSPWGDGRPGWHTECVVMSLDLLGDRFDLHAGGMDLRFPHHENERAQAVALGHQFASHWMHHAFVEVEGEKMSKSLDNFTNLLDLIDEADPRSYRLLVLQSHYRTPMDVTKETVARAEKTMAGLDGFARRFAAVDGVVEPASDVLGRFRERMDDDLDTPGAMALLFDTERRANRDDDTSAAAAVFEMARAVGLELRAESADVGRDASALARARDEARAAKDWALADSLRDQLIELGYEVHDTAQGTELRRR